MNRREALRLGTATLLSFALSGCCRPKKQAEFISPTSYPTEAPDEEELQQEKGTAIINEWVYTIGFDETKFFENARRFSLPLPQESVNIILTEETRAYKTADGRTKSHQVILGEEGNPDEIRISCGRYSEEVKKQTGHEPSTSQDQLLLSVALSQSILTGIADLAVAHERISEEQAMKITESYLRELFSSHSPDELIFTNVYIFDQQPSENKV